MKTEYVSMRLRPETLGVIYQANEIIESFQAQGYRMTLRQLYYQFVTKNLISNEEKSYKKLASIVSDGRLAGYIDWDAIEDRGRQPEVPRHYDDLPDIMRVIKNAADGYSLDPWVGQPFYCELWVEKQALAGVLEPLARRFSVPLMVNKGYSSQSAMFAAAKRFREGMATTGDPDLSVRRGEDRGYAIESERKGVLFYLGDHDPSGEDMVRDIRERLDIFGCGDQLDVVKVALTTAQVRQYRPPPNPAKLTDPRAEEYVRIHGRQSWEVDSLDPPVLVRLITQAITAVIDRPVLDAVREKEEADRTTLRRALDEISIEDV